MINRLMSTKTARIIFLWTSCIVLALSLVTYSEFDHSLNTYSILYPTNILGYFGSYIADIFIQIFGICSWIIVASQLLLSISVMKGIVFTNIKLRLIASFISSFLIAILVAYFVPSISDNFPIMIVTSLSKLDNMVSNSYLAVSFFLSLFLLVYGAGIPFSYFADFFLFIWQIISTKRPSQSKKQQVLNHSKKLAIQRIARDHTYDDIESNDEEDLPRNSTKIKSSNNDGTDFLIPDLDLLSSVKDTGGAIQSEEELNMQAEELLNVLKDFGVRGNIIEINQGPVVTLYEFEPSAGTKSSRVIGLADDIARSLSAVSTRIAVIPGRNVLGIELPNKTREFFRIKGLLESKAYQDPNIQLPIILGKDLAGKPSVVDLAKMPHLLVAGTTGSGKSVAINTMIVSLLYKHTPKECRFIMIDPKMLELSVYDGIPHLLSPVVTEPGKAVVALKWAVREMENRYRLMSNVGVRNINGYNQRIAEAIKNGEELKRTVQTGFDIDTGKPIFESVPIEMEQLPFIVIIVDEMADLMLVAGKDIESSIQRLAQMARAAGIHLIMATQRPSVDVITGVIKANFPSRVSFKVTSKIDSRTILGEQGAEQLLGMGDMLYMGTSSKILRVHGPFVEDQEVERISRFLKDQGTPEYIQAVTASDEETSLFDDAIINSDDTSDDGLYKQALQIVKRERKSSTSYIQRSLRIGYNRAAILVERLEKDGILSAPNSTGKREILIDEE